MSKQRSKAPITDLLRRTIAESGIPLLRLSNDADVARASLIRFVRGDSSLRLDVADKLAAYLGLVLVKKSLEKRMTPKKETVLVQGRKIVLATGDKTQTVNICDTANQEGTYEESQRFVEQFAITKEWLASYGALDALKHDLRRKADYQLRTLAGI